MSERTFREQAVRLVLDSYAPGRGCCPSAECERGDVVELGSPVPSRASGQRGTVDGFGTCPFAGAREGEPRVADEDRVPGKSGGLLRPGVSVSSKYEFIDGEKANYPISRMCVWAAVSRSGFYEWAGRPTSATASRRFWLAVQVAKVFRRVDGAPTGIGGSMPNWPAAGIEARPGAGPPADGRPGSGVLPAQAMAGDNDPGDVIRGRSTCVRRDFTAAAARGTVRWRHHLHRHLGRAGCTWRR